MSTIGKYDISTTAGSVAADKAQRALYDHMMAKTAAERFKYLANSGWTQLGKENVPSQDGTKTFVRVSWRAPESYNETHITSVEGTPTRVPKVFNQTKALLYEIWMDMERKGRVYRGDKLPALGAAIAKALPVLEVEDTTPRRNTSPAPPVDTATTVAVLV